MASRFQRIVDAIKAQLDIDVPNNTTTFLVGVKKRSEQRDTNQVVWVRTGGRVEEADQAGSRQHDSEVSPGTDVSSVPIRTDVYRVEADVWGDDQEATDTLREAVVRAAHNSLFARSVIAGDWIDITESPETAGHMLKGAKHRIEFEFRVPILEYPTEQALVLLTSEAHPCEFVDQATFEATAVEPHDLDAQP